MIPIRASLWHESVGRLVVQQRSDRCNILVPLFPPWGLTRLGVTSSNVMIYQKYLVSLTLGSENLSLNP